MIQPLCSSSVQSVCPLDLLRIWRGLSFFFSVFLPFLVFFFVFLSEWLQRDILRPLDLLRIWRGNDLHWTKGGFPKKTGIFWEFFPNAGPPPPQCLKRSTISYFPELVSFTCFHYFRVKYECFGVKWVWEQYFSEFTVILRKKGLKKVGKFSIFFKLLKNVFFGFRYLKYEMYSKYNILIGWEKQKKHRKITLMHISYLIF